MLCLEREESEGRLALRVVVVVEVVCGREEPLPLSILKVSSLGGKTRLGAFDSSIIR